MASTVDFHSQIASIMEVLANAAVAEICKLVDDGYSVIQLEVSRSQKETEILRKKIKLLELQVARYRAERLKASEGSLTRQGFPVTRHLLGRQGRDPSPGTSQQTKNRYLNRGARSPQSVQKPPPIILDQDPDQEVVTTTKTEPAEPEEEEQQQGEEKEEGEDQKELVIVKVEGGMEIDTAHQGASSDADIIRGDSDPTTSFPTAMREDGGQLSETEVSGSDVTPFVVSRTETECCDSAHRSQLTGSDVRAGGTDMTASCDDVGDGRREEALSLSEVVVVGEVMRSDQAQGGGVRLEHTTSFITHQPSGSLFGTLNDPAGPSQVDPASSISSSINPPVITVSRPSGLHRPPHHAFYQTVSMERPFGCLYCTKRFYRESDRQKHAARHMQERQHTCLLCGKSFVCQSQLEIHQNVHTGARPFTCSICNRSFSHPSNLRRHEKIQH